MADLESFVGVGGEHLLAACGRWSLGKRRNSGSRSRSVVIHVVSRLCLVTISRSVRVWLAAETIFHTVRLREGARGQVMGPPRPWRAYFSGGRGGPGPPWPYARSAPAQLKHGTTLAESILLLTITDLRFELSFVRAFMLSEEECSVRMLVVCNCSVSFSFPAFLHHTSCI